MEPQKQNPFVVGVSGGIGSGKTAVTDFLAQQGITVVDADIASRTVVEPSQPALEEIATRFGPEVLLEDGALNRKKLRDIIFNDKKEKKWLEQLLHPKINQLIRQQLADATSAYVALVSPLLAETEQYKMADRILVVDVSKTIQLERSMKRDEMSKEQAQRIIKSQASREQRLAIADDIINNSGTINELYSCLIKLHQTYLLLSARG